MTTDATKLLDHPLIGGRYFFPHGAATQPAGATPLAVRCADGTVLRCLRVGPRAAPCLVHFHGNGELASDHLDLARWLAARGVATVLAEYRGYGGSEGSPLLATMLDDVGAVLEAAQSEPSRTVVFGRSVGSIYAIEAAARQPALAGLVLESGIADVLERILLRVAPAELGATRGQLERAVAERLDHAARLAGFPAPTLVMHTRFDHLVDVSHGERLARWAPDATLRIFERGDHNSIFIANEDAYLGALGDFLERVLG